MLVVPVIDSKTNASRVSEQSSVCTVKVASLRITATDERDEPQDVSIHLRYWVMTGFMEGEAFVGP